MRLVLCRSHMCGCRSHLGSVMDDHESLCPFGYLRLPARGRARGRPSLAPCGSGPRAATLVPTAFRPTCGLDEGPMGLKTLGAVLLASAVAFTAIDAVAQTTKRKPARVVVTKRAGLRFV